MQMPTILAQATRSLKPATESTSLLTHPIFIGVLVVVLLVVVLVLFNFLGIWIRARLAGAPVSMLAMVAMRLRGVPVAQIVDARVTATKAGLHLETDPIEAHYLAGGDIQSVILALIAADKAGIAIDYMPSHVAAADFPLDPEALDAYDAIILGAGGHGPADRSQ